MAYATDKLARFAATLRAGRTVEFIDETPGQRITRAVTSFRLGVDRLDGDLVFQIQTQVTSRSGSVSTSPFGWCDWTVQEVYEHLRDYPEIDAQLMSSEEARRDDIAQLIEKASYKPVCAGAYSFEYHPEDDALLVCARGPDENDQPMRKPHHSFDDLAMRELPAETASTIRAATVR